MLLAWCPVFWAVTQRSQTILNLLDTLQNMQCITNTPHPSEVLVGNKWQENDTE